jgi:hypothetical protein
MQGLRALFLCSARREGYRRSWLPTEDSAKWMELEHRSTLGRFQRIVEIDPVDDPNESDTERDASRHGSCLL